MFDDYENYFWLWVFVTLNCACTHYIVTSLAYLELSALDAPQLIHLKMLTSSCVVIRLHQRTDRFYDTILIGYFNASSTRTENWFTSNQFATARTSETACRKKLINFRVTINDVREWESWRKHESSHLIHVSPFWTFTTIKKKASQGSPPDIKNREMQI